ncbi:MAG: YfiR family protein [Acidobacteria bacterium]|nr:YfiR family protein [Acidobacteriota bacterium]
MRYSGASQKRSPTEFRIPWGSLRFLVILVTLGSWIHLWPALHAEQPSEYALKAEFIERFTRFVDWPEDRVFRTGHDGSFVIGIVGEDPFGPHLQRLARSRRIKGERIQIHGIIEPEDVVKCQLLFISESEKSRLRAILAQAGGRPILTIGDTPGFAEAGVLINFYLDGDRIRFEINETAFARSGLHVDTKLLKLARVIGSGEERR